MAQGLKEAAASGDKEAKKYLKLKEKHEGKYEAGLREQEEAMLLK